MNLNSTSEYSIKVCNLSTIQLTCLVHSFSSRCFIAKMGAEGESGRWLCCSCHCAKAETENYRSFRKHGSLPSASDLRVSEGSVRKSQRDAQCWSPSPFTFNEQQGSHLCSCCCHAFFHRLPLLLTIATAYGADITGENLRISFLKWVVQEWGRCRKV